MSNPLLVETVVKCAPTTMWAAVMTWPEANTNPLPSKRLWHDGAMAVTRTTLAAAPCRMSAGRSGKIPTISVRCRISCLVQPSLGLFNQTCRRISWGRR
jgi:hypothetical protein